MEKIELAEGKELNFILAGNAVFTAVNERTGNRFTYKVVDINRTNAVGGDLERKQIWFVRMLTGPDNTSNFSFIGSIQKKDEHYVYVHSRKAHCSDEAPSVKCISWLIMALQEEGFPASVKVYHEGRCGRCGKRLTVPESILSGYGPECAGRWKHE